MAWLTIFLGVTLSVGKIGFYTFDLYGAWLPLLLVLVPPLLVKYVFPTQQSLTQKYWHGVGYLIGAAVSWVTSIHLPNLPVGDSESVTTHLMGGGLVAPFLFVYCKRRYISRDRMSKIYETLGLAFNPAVLRFAALIAFSCTFGVVNELAELVFVRTAMDTIVLDDTGSDLTANTVGTVLAFIGMELWRLRPARQVEPIHDKIHA